MKRFSRRLLTWVLAAAMVFGLSGMTAFATETENTSVAAEDGSAALIEAADNCCTVMEQEEMCDDCTGEAGCTCCCHSADEDCEMESAENQLLLPMRTSDIYNHGTMEITSDEAENGEITIDAGWEAGITIHPYVHCQAAGCGVSDFCPEKCLMDCFYVMYGCICVSTPLLCYADVEVDIADPSIVSEVGVFEDGFAEDLSLAEIMDGKLYLFGENPGTTTVTVTTSLRDWISATETFTVTVKDGEDFSYPDFSVYQEGQETLTVTGTDFARAEKTVDEQEFTYITDTGATETVTEKFVRIEDLLGKMQPDEGCGFIVSARDEEVPLFTAEYADNAYLYYDENDGCYHTAVDGASEDYWADDLISLTLGHLYEDGICIICDAEEPEVGAFAVYSADDNSLTFYMDNIPIEGKRYNGKVATELYENVDSLRVTTSSGAPWNSYRAETTSVVFDESFKDAQPVSLAYWFYFFQNAAFEGLEYLDTSRVTNMAYLFNYCNTFADADLSGWDTSQVTNMSAMFNECTSLTSVGDLSDWNTSQVTNMQSMFSSCTNLTSIGDLSGWDITQVADISSLFKNCVDLTALDGLAAWDTSNVENMEYLFFGCSSLTEADVSKWDTSEVTNMRYLFDGCSSLTRLDVSGWDTSHIKNMTSIFYNCSALTSLDLSNWDTSTATSLYAMFEGCTDLASLDVSGWDTSQVTDMRYTFYDCAALGTLDLSDWDTTAVTSYSSFALGDTAPDCVKLGGKTDIFRNAKLINTQTWYDSPTNGTVTSRNYLRDAAYPGEYWSYTAEEGEPTVRDVTVTSNIEGNSKTYDGAGFNLSVSAAVEPEGAEVTYQWYGPDGEAIDGANSGVFTTGSSVADSGTYKCVVTAVNDGLTAEGSAEITITIGKAAQDISYAETAIEKTTIDDAFMNPLTETTVSAEEGAGITYASSDTSVATVDENGQVTIFAAGETTITATAAGTADYEAAGASYTLTVAEHEHTWGEVTWSWAEDYSSAEASRTCEVCGETETAQASITSETTDPTATEPGSIVYTATAVFEDGTETIDTRTEVIPALEAPSVNVTVTSTLTDNTKTYDGIGVSLTATAQVTPDTAEVVSYQWFGPDGLETAIDGAEANLLNLDGSVADSGTYKCVVTAVNDGLTAEGSAEITITIGKAAQDISYAETAVEKTVGDDAFTNPLTETTVSAEEGAGITYASSDTGVATVDGNGQVTILAAGETTITATAAGTADYEEAGASYTLTVTPALEAPTVNVTVTSTLTDNTKTYDGIGVSLTAAAQVTPDTAEVATYRWYAVAGDGTETAIDGAETNLLNLDGSVADSGTYKCVVTAVNDGLTAEGSAEITIAIGKAAQDISYAETAVEKTVGDDAFTNPLTETTVSTEEGAGITYASSDTGVATVDGNGQVTILAAGEATITATAAGTADYEEAGASYTLTVSESTKEQPGGSDKNGLYQITPGKLWGYYVDGIVDTSYTGFASNSNGKWYVVNGYIEFNQNTVAKDKTGAIGTKGTWYYVVGNKVQDTFTGLANYKNENGWWYIVKGEVDFSHNGVDKNKNGWYYVTGGKVQFGFTGLANYKNANGWWYISGGKVNFNANTVAKNKNGWWLVEGGKVNFNYTGVSNYKNANGWWYVKNGKVDFTFTGRAKNKNGTWNVVKGKVQF